MATNTQKPLPAIPRARLNSQNLTALTLDSQSHLALFIRQLLAEHEQAELNDGVRQAWAEAIEAGLTELGVSMARGGWLAGLKRRRKALKARRDKEVNETNKEKAAALQEQHDASEDKAKRKDGASAEATVPVGQHSECRGPFAKTRSPLSRNADTALALDQIRMLVARPVVPTPKPSPKHLLLTLAALGSRIALPAEDSGFDLVPATIACVFTSGVYSLPARHCHDIGDSVILYGLDEWNG
jgi:1-phosphatidylinositol-3-phosphate 5-kinase